MISKLRLRRTFLVFSPLIAPLGLYFLTYLRYIGECEAQVFRLYFVCCNYQFLASSALFFYAYLAVLKSVFRLRRGY
jgi:hypothetical protein